MGDGIFIFTDKTEQKLCFIDSSQVKESNIFLCCETLMFDKLAK